MANQNLVPIHLDKSNGRLVARGGHFTTTNANGFLYEQLLPEASWLVPHNALNDQVLVQIYDELGEFTLPNKIDIVDLNNILIEFNAPMGGTAHILFFSSI